MKAAFFVYDLSEKNGWGRYSIALLTRLMRQGVEPVIFAIEGAEPNPLFAGIPFYPVLKSYEDGWGKPLRLLADYARIRKSVRGCEAFHSMVEPFLILVWLLAGRRAPLFVTAHGTYSVEILKRPWRSLYRRAYRGCRRIFSVSGYTASRILAMAPELKPLILTIPNGVEAPKDRAPVPAAARERAFLTVGEIKPRKGILEAVQALGKVTREFPDASLYIVGRVNPGVYVEAIKAAARAAGIEDRVIWKGRVSETELEGLYSRVRGLVMPSINANGHFEGFGLVHLEANAFGVPAIGSRDCGNEDAIREGRSGFLVKQKDVEGLAAAMRKLLDPEFAWDSMSAGALAFAREMNWDKIVPGYLEAYRHTP
jgi:glycosyltransferase involved in cell wall biosynthesis